jgi:hypothetical protein
MKVRALAKKIVRKINNQSPKPIGFRDDRLARRQRFVQAVADHSENGFVSIVWSGRDCDGVYGCHAETYKACPIAIEADIERRYEWADGPMSFEFAKPSDIYGFESYSRDLGAEAFEDGHNHIIYG